MDNSSIGCLVMIGVYFIPAFVASHREHHNLSAISALNTLLGWTVLGWAIALIWALTSSPEREAPNG